jgi:hypothetical protein
MNSLAVGADLLEQIEREAQDAVLDTVTFYTSALHSEGLADMKNYLLAQAPRRPWRLDMRDPTAADEEDEDEVDAREEAALDSLLQGTQGTGVDPNSIEGRAFMDRLLGEEDGGPGTGSRTNGGGGGGGGIAMRPQRVTGQSRKQLVEQFVLEALMVHLHDEIPYEANIRCTGIEPYGSRADKVYQCAVCSVQCAVCSVQCAVCHCHCHCHCHHERRQPYIIYHCRHSVTILSPPQKSSLSLSYTMQLTCPPPTSAVLVIMVHTHVRTHRIHDTPYT